MNSEREVEIKLWDWIKTKSYNVKEIFFNSINEVNAPIFKVRGNKKIPDLLILFLNPYTNEKQYMAVEVKDATNSINVRNGRKIYDIYLKNYIKGKTKYFIDNQEIKISHFAIATQYSECGHLKKNEKLEFNEKVRGKSFGNKNVPFFEFISTKEIYRGMLSSYSQYRKSNKLISVPLPSLGILISDVLKKFDIIELERQYGMEGSPMYQCSTYNPNSNKGKGGFTQCLMKI